MRVSLLAVGLFVLKASAAGSPVADLRGTARAGDRPQPSAVVWLEAPNAPSSREAKRPVLDQRNLSFSPHVLAVDSPYFTVSDERGAFSIPLVPAGTFTYHAWRPGGPDLTGAVAIDAGQPLDIHWP